MATLISCQQQNKDSTGATAVQPWLEEITINQLQKNWIKSWLPVKTGATALRNSYPQQDSWVAKKLKEAGNRSG